MAIKTIKILDENPERYTLKPNTNCLGRMWDNYSEQIKVQFPQFEMDNGSECSIIVYANGKQIDKQTIENDIPFDITNVWSRYDIVSLGFEFTKGADYVKNSEEKCFYFALALKPNDFIPETPIQQRQFTQLVNEAFADVGWSSTEPNTLQFSNIGGQVIKSIELSPFVQEQADLAETDTTSETFVRNKSTIYLANEGEDGTSPYATQQYVSLYGGKIDSISVNGVAQTIDANKNVDISVPTNTVLTNSAFSVSGDDAIITNTFVDLGTQVASSDVANVPLANDTTAGLMSYADYNQIRDNTSRIEALEGKTTRLYYSNTTLASNINIASSTTLAVGTVLKSGSVLNGVTLLADETITTTTSMEVGDSIVIGSIIANGSIINQIDFPRQSDINSFVVALGYTSPFEGIAVVTAVTYHIWHYYENNGIGWRDDGVDTVVQFTNNYLGLIKGAAEDGKVYAETNGTGSVYGWSDLKSRVSNLESNSATKTELAGKQDTLVSGENIKTINGNSVLGSGDLVVKTYKQFPTTWVTSGTITQFMQSVENDSNAVKGMVYLGELTCSDLPFVGNGDAVVEIVDGTATEKVIVLSLNSGDVEPYYWRYTYWVISDTAHSSGWISFVPTTRTVNGKALSSNITLTALDVNAESIATYETYTITSNSWTALSSSEPFTYQTTVTATYTIGNDTEVGIINDQPVLFANYGFIVGSVSGQNVTLYAIGQPDTSVSLTIGYRG